MMGTEHIGFILRAVGSLGEVSEAEGYCYFGKDPLEYLGREWIQGDKVGQSRKRGLLQCQVRGRMLGKGSEERKGG